MTKLSIAAIVGFAACASSPPTRATSDNLEQQARATLGEMRAKDPSITDVLNNTYAYAVFPDVGKAGAVGVGGAYGHGILFEHGQPTGYVTIEQGSVGAELGGETFAELLVLRNANDVQTLKGGHFDLGVGADAVALKEGAAATATFRKGRAVFVMPRGGLMVDVSLKGQRIDYQPLAG